MMKNMRMLFSQKGFTLPEVILTVAVLAILVSMTTPALMNFMRQRDIREETTMQLKIRDAMQAMLAATDTLPVDTASGTSAWYNMLARYSDLSPNQIQFDEWGQPRAYIMMSSSQQLLGSNINISYVTLHSSGPDTKATAITNSGGQMLVPVSGNSFASASATNWWKNNSALADKVAAFGDIGVPATSDDIMLRYTNYPEKIAAYNETLQRMSKVTDGLEAYSKAHYAERVVYCAPLTDGNPANGEHYSGNPASTDNCVDYSPDKQIHYPMGYGIVGGDSYNYYNAAVLNEVNAGYGVSYITNITGSTANDTARRDAMIRLMRVLGLPDSYCCSALEHFTDNSGKVQEWPFFYASNPRARSSTNSCGARYSFTGTQLPARLTTLYVPDGTTGASCF